MPKPLEIMIETKNTIETFYEDDTDYSDVYVIMLEMLVRHQVTEFKTDPKTNTQFLELTPLTFNHALSVLDTFDLEAMSKEWAIHVEDITVGKKIIDSYIINQLDQENLVSVTFKIHHYETESSPPEASDEKEAHYFLATSKRLTIGTVFILLGLTPLLTYVAISEVRFPASFSLVYLVLIIFAILPISLGLNQLFYSPYLIGLAQRELYFSLWLDYDNQQPDKQASKKYTLLIFPRKSKKGMILNLADIHSYQFKENPILNSRHLEIKMKSSNTQTLSLDLLSYKDYIAFKETFEEKR